MTEALLLIILIVFLIFAIIAVVIIYNSTNKRQYKNDVHISGGADATTGQISSDDDYFKGISGIADETLVANINYRALKAESMSITINNMNTLKSTKATISGELIIGRGSDDKNFRITNDNTVSKNHCKLYIYKGKLYICDLNSANHTYLNGVIVMSPQLCKSGDIVRAGNTQLKLVF